MLKDKELKDRIIEDHEGSSANSDMTLDRLRGRIEKIAAANLPSMSCASGTR